MPNLLLTIASFFCCSTTLYSMDNQNNLMALSKEVLENPMDGDKLHYFMEKCERGAFDQDTLLFLTQEESRIEKKKEKEKKNIPDDEVYYLNIELLHSNNNESLRHENILRMITALKQSRYLRLIKLPDHKIENNGK